MILWYLFSADCGAPVYVENSKTIYPTSTVEGAKLTLECVEGTVPEGSRDVFCQSDGTWTKPTLYCRRKFHSMNQFKLKVVKKAILTSPEIYLTFNSALVFCIHTNTNTTFVQLAYILNTDAKRLRPDFSWLQKADGYS